MTDLQQAIRDSAEALGFQIVTIEGWVAFHDEVFVAMPMGGGYYNTRWNPPEDGNQDRLLRDWLLENGWSTNNNPDTDNKIWKFPEEDEDTDDPELFWFDCPANEFLTRATAAVWAAKESEK